FFLGPAFGSVVFPHLSLNPQGETHFLNFEQESIDTGHTENEGEKMRENTLMLKYIAILRARKLLQEVTTHKLLRNRRATLRKQQYTTCGIVAVRTAGAA